ncbi:tRNA (guanine-N(7)-)-methyltransferase non-catalytic subunit wuho [Harmonia axyridis]|uniref:tRNA (guanine-N(7)-)-methyltransferase non-catalytic subunit wuho n=1 Tax=Harmonia axyridis TaxID=115357 RepID=UPI001E27656D|nr:tRNA (guanine-N(7)-)-methyltransferase non-catalytic subunit wuho [Harmonia axyridis]
MVTMKKCGERILFYSGKKLIVYNEDNIKTVDLPAPILKIQKQEENNKTKEDVDAIISCLSVSKDHKYIAVSTETKQVVIYNEYFEIIKNFTVPRIASNMCFTSNDSLIVADKTGDVFLYNMKDEILTPVLLLGHLSIVLDVALTDCGKYIITSDRDEKIRVSKFPNSYNIQSFCLGHEEFVLSVIIVQNKLISASGDGTVRFWDYLDGKQLSVINTNDYINEELVKNFKEEMGLQDAEVFALPITDMQCFSRENDIFIGISLFKYNKLLLFSLNPSLRINFCKHIYVGGSFSFYLSKDLLILTSTKILFFKLEGKNYREDAHKNISIDDVHDLRLKSDNNISLLYKKKFDNMEEYIERKRARLKLK